MEQKKFSIKRVIAVSAVALMFLSLDATNNVAEAQFGAFFKRSQTFYCRLFKSKGDKPIILAKATVNYIFAAGSKKSRVTKVYLDTKSYPVGKQYGTIGHKSAFRGSYCGHHWNRPRGTMDKTRTTFSGRGTRACKVNFTTKFTFTADINIAGVGQRQCSTSRVLY